MIHISWAILVVCITMVIHLSELLENCITNVIPNGVWNSVRLILGVDAGNYQAKSAGPYGVDTFRTSICDWFLRDFNEQFGSDDMEFEIDGRRGFSGTIASYEDEYGVATLYGDTKAHEDTKIRVLLAIHRYVERYCPGIEEITLVIGQPIISHQEDEKQKLIMMLEGPHEITVNGARRRYHIRDIAIAAEGSSAFWSMPSSNLCRYIDIGSGTINCATIRDKRIIQNASGTFNFGMETVSDKNNLDSIARGIIRSTAQLKWQRQDNVFVCGGIANKILPYLVSHYDNARTVVPQLRRHDGVIEGLEPVYANAVGFYEIARLVFNHA